ncbi:hypothetical protein OG264_11675 [Streptomyces xanthophaeus]|uniref:helix-turn-helix domain-containing protein n=1 Tax=Streptomyces xanthophaeus TaxID=67385 RepID=UPI00386EEE75|nr:hypothetical protein OG264_11675 [Streptomyces xanthophaeus]
MAPKYKKESYHIESDALRAELRIRAYQMQLKRVPVKDIAVELGCSGPTVRKLIKEYIDELTVPLAEKARAMELDKLNTVEAIAWKVLEENHVTVSHGKVIMMDGVPLKDTDPIFKALSTILKTSESIRKLLGLDMPTESVHTVRTESVVDASILSLVEEMEEANRVEAERLNAQG